MHSQFGAFTPVSMTFVREGEKKRDRAESEAVRRARDRERSANNRERRGRERREKEKRARQREGQRARERERARERAKEREREEEREEESERAVHKHANPIKFANFVRECVGVHESKHVREKARAKPETGSALFIFVRERGRREIEKHTQCKERAQSVSARDRARGEDLGLQQ